MDAGLRCYPKIFMGKRTDKGKQMKASSEDIEKGFKYCDDCEGERVHLLQAGFDVTVNKCGKCGTYTASGEDFKTNEAIKVMSK